MLELIYVAHRKHETAKLEREKETRLASAEWKSTRPNRMLKMSRYRLLESTEKEKYDTTLYHRQNGTVRARGVWEERRLDFGTYQTEVKAHQVATTLAGIWALATFGRDYNESDILSLGMSEPILSKFLTEMQTAARLALSRRKASKV
jgi:hypothetical protein